MGDESTSNEKEARFWDLYRTYYAFARTFGRLGRWRAFLSAILRTSNSLSFLMFPRLAKIGLQWAYLKVLCFPDAPRTSFLVFPRCFPR